MKKVKIKDAEVVVTDGIVQYIYKISAEASMDNNMKVNAVITACEGSEDEGIRRRLANDVQAMFNAHTIKF